MMVQVTARKGESVVRLGDTRDAVDAGEDENALAMLAMMPLLVLGGMGAKAAFGDSNDDVVVAADALVCAPTKDLIDRDATPPTWVLAAVAPVARRRA